MNNPFYNTMNPWDKMYSDVTGLPYPLSAAVDAAIPTYSYISYGPEGQEWSEGTCKATGKAANDRLEVRILNDNHEEYNNQRFWISDLVEDHVGDDTKFDLYASADAAESVGIQVAVYEVE